MGSGRMTAGWKLALPRRPKGQPREHIGKYHNARYCAAQRGIEWQFNYDTWIDWWGNDMQRRGPYKGQLVMARRNDTGPYHPDNVDKMLSSDNCRDGTLGIKRSDKFRAKCRLREELKRQKVDE